MTNAKNSDFTIQFTSEKASAVANGVDVNTVTLFLQDKGEAVANARVVFTVDGQAVFVSGQAGTYVANTDGGGRIRLDVVDTIIENVTVSCFPVEQKENVAQLELIFSEARKIFKIDRVQTKSQTLYPGEPNIMWDSASFLLETSGGSGEVEWSFPEDYKGEFKLQQDEYGAAEVTALSWFIGSRTVRATDKVTGETAEHIFIVDDYIYISREKEALSDVLNETDKTLLSKDKFKRIYDQWGDLSKYNGWSPDTFFWTSEYDLISNKATCFNSSTGIFIEGGYLSFNEPVLQGFVYIVNSENDRE